MAKFGLPTYPIVNGMRIDSREDSEIEWLLERGYIQGNGIRYLTKEDDDYLLVEQGDGGDTVIDSGEHWQTLTQKYDINMAFWHWYEQI